MAKKRKRVRPADVIDGRAKPGPRALVSLIAEVNPTGRELSPSDQARRYAEKSALQSALLRWYGDSFFAEPTDDPRIVLLRHRHFDECACHAQVSSLDDAARAWVWENLDDADSTAASETRVDARSAPDEASPASAVELLAQANAALAAYDYERAEHLLFGAFEMTAAAPGASRALLELLVDVLGQNARALELEPRLSAEARTDPPVRSLLGLAAARAGDATRALAIVSDLAHPRAGEVCAEAGRAALRSGQLEQARGCAEQARSLGAAPDAASLEAAIENALRARVPTEEARLEALLAAGDPEGAEALARDILGAGVPSTKAQRLLREAAARRIDSAERELSTQARAAIENGNFAAARKTLDELAALDRPASELEVALAEAQRAASAARDERAVREVLDAFSRDLEAGITAYLELNDALRERVRSAGPSAPCERAELVRDALKRPRPAEVAATVLRIGELERALDEGRVEAAVEAAESLPRRLEALPFVLELRDRAACARDERDAAILEAQLDHAYEAILDGRAEDAAQHLTRISVPPGGQAAVDEMLRLATLIQELEGRVAHAREPDADLVALHAGCMAAEKLSGVFDLLEKSDSTREDQRGASRARAQQWAEESMSLSRAKSAALRLEEHPVPEGTVVDLEDERELGAHAPDVRIDDNENIWFIASPEERCYLTEATLPDLTVVRRLSFTAGELRRGQSVVPVGKALWIPLSDGGMIVLDREDPSIVLDAWWGPGERGDPIDDAWATVSPDGRAVLEGTPKIDTRGTQLRVPASGAARALHSCASVCFFGRGERALVTGGRRRAWYVVSTPDLTPIAGADRFTGPFADLVPIAAIDDPTADPGDPNGGHIFLAVDATTVEARPDAEPSSGALHLVRVTSDLKPLEHRMVTARCFKLRAWIYRAQDHVLLAHCYRGYPRFDLFDGATLEPIGASADVEAKLSRATPGLTVPVQDARGTRLTFLERTHHAFRTAAAPTPFQAPEPSRSMPFLSGALSPRAACAHSPDAWARPLYARQLDTQMLRATTTRTDRARSLHVAAAARWGERFMRQVIERSTAQLMLELIWKTQEKDNLFMLFQGAEYAISLSPSDPEIVARLEAALDTFEKPVHRAHTFHLLGLAHLAMGRREAAVAAWRRGAKEKIRHCKFTLLLAVMGDLSKRERTRMMRGTPPVAFVHDHAARYERAVAAMARLDAALEAGRGEDAWAEARRIRDAVGPSWQLSARVAQLHLDHPDPSVDPWRYQLDLAWMASCEWLRPTRNHMIFAGSHWDHQRFSAISKRAGEAIDSLGIGPARRIADEALEAEAQSLADGASGAA